MFLLEIIIKSVDPILLWMVFFELIILFFYIYLSYSFVYYLKNNKNQRNTYWKNVLAPKKSNFFTAWRRDDNTVFNSTVFPLCILPVALTLLCCTVLLFLHMSQAIGVGGQKWFHIVWNFHMVALVLFLYIILPTLFIQFVIQMYSFSSFFISLIHWVVMILLTLFMTIVVPFVSGKKIFYLSYSDIGADSLLLRCSLYGVILASTFGGFGVTQIVFTYFLPYQISQEYIKTLKLYYNNIDTRLDKIKNDIYSYPDIQRTLTSVSHTDKLKEKKKFWGILCLGHCKSKEDVFLVNEVKLLEQAKQEIQEEIDECLTLEKAKKYNSFFPLLFQRLFRFLVVIFCISQIAYTFYNMVFHRITLLDPINSIYSFFNKNKEVPTYLLWCVRYGSFFILAIVYSVTLHQLISRAAFIFKKLRYNLTVELLVILLTYIVSLHVCAYLLLFRFYLPLHLRYSSKTQSADFYQNKDILLQHLWNFIFTLSVIFSGLTFFIHRQISKEHVFL